MKRVLLAIAFAALPACGSDREEHTVVAPAACDCPCCHQCPDDGRCCPPEGSVVPAGCDCPAGCTCDCCPHGDDQSRDHDSDHGGGGCDGGSCSPNFT